MIQLTSLETEIIKEIVSENPGLEGQVSRLQVKNREFTGFGLYVNFYLQNQIDLTTKIQGKPKFLSCRTEFVLDTLEYPISFELNLNEKGQFEFLEIVPNGVDEWNGKFKKFRKQK